MKSLQQVLLVMIKDKKVKIGDLVGIDVYYYSEAMTIKTSMFEGKGVIIGLGDNSAEPSSGDDIMPSRSWIVYASDKRILHVAEKFIYEL